MTTLQPPAEPDQDAGPNDYPVDSATRACCEGIGRHTPDCEDSTEKIHPAGPFPGMTPVACAPWCKDGDGHTSSYSRADQVCWGDDRYVELSLEEVVVEFSNDSANPSIWPSVIGPCAYRGYNQLPCVCLHFTLQEHGVGRELDESCKLTASEARELAAALIAVADQIDGAR